MQEPRAEASILRGSITGQHQAFIHCLVLDEKVRNEEPETIKVRFHPAPFTTHRIGRSRFCGPYQLGIGMRCSKEQGQMVEDVMVPCILSFTRIRKNLSNVRVSRTRLEPWPPKSANISALILSLRISRNVFDIWRTGVASVVPGRRGSKN